MSTCPTQVTTLCLWDTACSSFFFKFATADFYFFEICHNIVQFKSINYIFLSSGDYVVSFSQFESMNYAFLSSGDCVVSFPIPKRLIYIGMSY